MIELLGSVFVRCLLLNGFFGSYQNMIEFIKIGIRTLDDQTFSRYFITVVFTKERKINKFRSFLSSYFLRNFHIVSIKFDHEGKKKKFLSSDSQVTQVRVIGSCCTSNPSLCYTSKLKEREIVLHHPQRELPDPRVIRRGQTCRGCWHFTRTSHVGWGWNVAIYRSIC